MSIAQPCPYDEEKEFCKYEIYRGQPRFDKCPTCSRSKKEPTELEVKVSDNEWHFLKDGDLPRQDGNTCFSIEVLSDTKKWVYYQFGSGKWFCRNKQVKINAWREITFPKDCEQ